MGDETFTGDALLPDATMVYDRTTRIPVPRGDVWPWIVQLGKHRAGWYLPRSVERWLPAPRRASRRIEGRWQQLAVGDRLPDYGGPKAELDVAVVDAPRALVYRADRHGATFSWALLLTSHQGGGTDVHLRFRGRLRSTGWRRGAIVAGGDLVDWATTTPMLVGLAERAIERATDRSGAPG